MKRFIINNKFLNFFTRKYSNSVVFPAWTLEKFKQYYRSQITRISSATSKNPEDIPSYLANDYFRLALEKDPTAEAKIFAQELQKFTEDKKCKAVAVRGVDKLEKITNDQNCYFNALLASAIMSYVGKERVDSIMDSFFAGCVKYDIYELAKKTNNVNPINRPQEVPFDTSMNINKLLRTLNE